MKGPNTSLIEIPLTVQESWQKSVDLIARIANVPAALVMRVHEKEIEVFRSSASTDNPYEVGEMAALNTGLYCETVMAHRDRLLVPNALADPHWANNPDIALNMISYMGWPIIWPNGDVFGTICILDSKENSYDETKSQLLYQFKEMIEFSLRAIYDNHQLDDSRKVLRRLNEERRVLKKQATSDSLTGVYNRRAFLDIGNQLFLRLHQEQLPVALFILDIDWFKIINDHHGHLNGDNALIHVTSLLSSVLRRNDILARYGGDEFIVLAPETSLLDATALAGRINEVVRTRALNEGKLVIPITLSVGVYADVPQSPDLILAIKRADTALLKAKQKGRDRFVVWEPEQP